MKPFQNRNDEKWPHSRQIKIAGRNQILPPLGIEDIRDLTILGRQRDGNGYQYNRSLKRIE
jgi:hypothetical protein